MSRSIPTAVTAELSLRMVVDSDRTVEVPCELEYRSEEPYAVRATFRTGAADIEWMFARDLILEGLSGPPVRATSSSGRRTTAIPRCSSSP